MYYTRDELPQTLWEASLHTRHHCYPVDGVLQATGHFHMPFLYLDSNYAFQGAGTWRPSDKALTDPTAYPQGFQLTGPSSHVGKP